MFYFNTVQTRLLLLLVFSFLISCSGNNMSYKQNKNLKFSIEHFFEGDTIAYGIFEDRFNNLKRQFRVNINGKKTEDGIILNEEFLYDDGEKDTRIWKFKVLNKDKEGNIEYEGSTKDALGKAYGVVKGNIFNFKYDINLEISGKKIKVHFNDWIYQQDRDIAINRAYVSKFGINIGSVTLVFLRGDLSKSIGKLNIEEW